VTSAKRADGRWDAAVAVLHRLAARDGKVIRDVIDARNFGNRVFEVEVVGVRVRAVNDRGSVFIDITRNERWHSFRNLLCFAAGWSPEEAISGPEPPVGVLENEWNSLLAALDDPKLASFEAKVGAAMLASLAPPISATTVSA